MRYLALIRGINVGGKSLIKMIELKTAFEAAGFTHVMTYIQSGNVIFEAPSTETATLAKQIERILLADFKIVTTVVVFSADEWHEIVVSAPKSWGTDESYKHNLLILIGDTSGEDALQIMGALKPDIELAAAGKRVIYQSLSWTDFGKTTGGKLAGMPIYKQMTVRTFNTVSKLDKLLQQ
jgi:uncharacterized protein (DUF1697 family)